MHQLLLVLQKLVLLLGMISLLMIRRGEAAEEASGYRFELRLINLSVRYGDGVGSFSREVTQLWRCWASCRRSRTAEKVLKLRAGGEDGEVSCTGSNGVVFLHLTIKNVTWVGVGSCESFKETKLRGIMISRSRGRRR